MIVEPESDEPGRPVRPTAAEAARRLMGKYCVFVRGVIEAAVTSNGDMTEEEGEKRRAELLRWMVAGSFAPGIGEPGVRFLRTAVGEAAGADFRDALASLEFAAALAWGLGLRPSLGPVDRYAEPLEIGGRLPPPFGPGRPFVDTCRLVPDGALAGALNYCQRWCWRAEMALLGTGSGFGAGEQVAALLRRVARQALDEGVIGELIEGDFPVRGVAFARLSSDEAERISILSGIRAMALAWLLGAE